MCNAMYGSILLGGLAWPTSNVIATLARICCICISTFLLSTYASLTFWRLVWRVWPCLHSIMRKHFRLNWEMRLSRTIQALSPKVFPQSSSNSHLSLMLSKKSQSPILQHREITHPQCLLSTHSFKWRSTSLQMAPTWTWPAALSRTYLTT